MMTEEKNKTSISVKKESLTRFNQVIRSMSDKYDKRVYADEALIKLCDLWDKFG